MPKRRKRANSRDSFSSLARSISLLRSEIRLVNQELRVGFGGIHDEMSAGFDQVCRYIDGFINLHETLDIERRRELRDWKRVDS